MKRTQNESNLIPYERRRQSGFQEQTSKPLKHVDYFSTLPPELVFIILNDSIITFRNLKTVAWTCKSLYRIITSKEFGTPFMRSKNLKIKDDESWVKTYRLWLQTNCYILLDCSLSMDQFSRQNVYAVVNEIAQEVFRNKWWRGVTVGCFSDRFDFVNFAGMSQLNDFLHNIDEHLKQSRIKRSSTDILSVLTEVYDRINSQMLKKATESEVHVITDCNFADSKAVVDYIKGTPCKKSLEITFYRFGDCVSSSLFVRKINRLKYQDITTRVSLQEYD